MIDKHLDRRDFHRLSIAAVGGVLAAGLAAGCRSDDQMAAPEDAENPLLAEPHVCKGLNTCKGAGPGGDNQCAGTGQCATAAHHDCAGANECKGQGGCHGTAGMNECKGNGGCAVPLKPDAWKGARAAFEAAMKAEGKQVAPAPM